MKRNVASLDDSVKTDKKVESKDRKHEDQSAAVKKRTKLLIFFKTKKGKIIAVFGGVALVCVLLLSVPLFRDATLANFVHKSVTVAVVDDRSAKPVSGAVVEIDGVRGQTDANGIVTLDGIEARQQTILIRAANYEDIDQEYRVPFYSLPSQQTIEFHATGKPIELTITDSITNDALANVQLSSGEAMATTNDAGVATIVIPYSDKKQTIEAKHDGYNTASVIVQTGQPELPSKLSLTASGKLVYLSKATGVIDVMQSNVDGTGAKALVKGTGTERDTTTLSTTSDWKYSVLQTNTPDNKSVLYLVDSADGTKTPIDTGDNVGFSVKGWSGHTLFYVIYRYDIEYWQPKRAAVKAYDADAKKLHTVDETAGTGPGSWSYRVQQFENVYVLSDEVIIVKTWDYSSYYGGTTEKAQIISVQPDSLKKKIVHSFDNGPTTVILSKLRAPQEVYVQVVNNFEYDSATYFAYNDGNVSSLKNMTESAYNKAWPSYYMSQTGARSLWYEVRNGKNTLFVGDNAGNNGKTILDGSDYKPYGWYGSSDQYVLLTKDDSELYIASLDKLGNDGYAPLRVTSIHKVNYYWE